MSNQYISQIFRINFFLYATLLTLFLLLFAQSNYIYSVEQTSSLSSNHAIDAKITNERKKLLFIVNHLITGGMERAFVNMLRVIPENAAQIEVCILRRGGDYECRLPSHVNLVTIEEARDKMYDAVISYIQHVNPKIWVSTIKTKKRIQWIHSDIENEMNAIFFRDFYRYCKKIDRFVVVSEIAKKNFGKIFPAYAHKTECILNIIDNEQIRKQAVAYDASDEMKRGVYPTVITVARLAREKRIDLAIQVHKKLHEQGFNFKWYVVGDGPRRLYLQQCIQKAGLQNNFILLGTKSNPYSYIQKADIFCLLSNYEGYGLAVCEAKILRKPILVTNFKPAYEQIESGKNGFIVSKQVDDIARHLKLLLVHEDLRRSFTKELENFEFDNNKSYMQLSHILLK